MSTIKKTCFLVLAVLLSVAVFAEEKGFSATIDIDVNMVQWHHQELKNDTYIHDAEMPRTDSIYWMRNPNYDDVVFAVKYNDPDGKFGGHIGFDFNAGGGFHIGDLFGWVKATPWSLDEWGVHLAGKIGKYTDRVVNKVGGDKDLGVMLIAVRNNDVVIDTSDSLGLGSEAIGFIPTLSVSTPYGTLSGSGFFAPNEYWLGQRIIPTSAPDTTVLPITIPAYATYKFGGSGRYNFDGWADIGFASRKSHSKSESGLDLGKFREDWGIYGMVCTDGIGDILIDKLGIAALSYAKGLKLGLGVSKHLEYWDPLPGEKLIEDPWKTAFHFDIRYENISFGGVDNRLTVGFFSNRSSHTLAKEKTRNYNAVIALARPDVYGDESSTVEYNEFFVSFKVFDFLVPSLMIRNYNALLTNNEGMMGKDYGINNMIVEFMIKYYASSNVNFRAGFKYEIKEYGTPTFSDVLQNTWNAYSIPIGVTVNW